MAADPIDPKILHDHKNCTVTKRVHWSDARHPLWSLARISLLGIIISPIIYSNSAEFGIEQLQSIATILTLFGAADYGMAWLKRRTPKQ